MSGHQRSVYHPAGVAGLEQVGHDVRSGTLPLGEHAHDGTEICYLRRGEVTWVVGRRRLRLVGGSISVVGPGLAHKGEFDVIAPSDLYWAVLRASEITPRLDRDTLRGLAARQAWVAPAPRGVDQLFARAVSECAQEQAGWRAATAATLSLLAVECSRAGAARNRSRGNRLPGPVAEAARILVSELEDPPAVRALAKRVGLGPTRFHQLFKESIGLTPRDYLARVRLSEARLALAGGAGDITALAFRLGFPSSQHFATVFRKHTGMTPTAFRARARKEQSK
jgi:AraC-like DNA-binding protein